MAREVNSTQPYQDKLVKLIPTEIVGAYMVLAGMLGFGAADPNAQSQAPAVAGAVADIAAKTPPNVLNSTLIQIVFFALLIATPLYLRKISKVTNITQLAVTTFSYVVWVYTLGGPFVVWGIYFPIIGSVILVLWSVFSHDRVEVTGLRPLPLPHHRTCGFPHPAVGPGGLHSRKVGWYVQAPVAQTSFV